MLDPNAHAAKKLDANTDPAALSLPTTPSLQGVSITPPAAVSQTAQAPQKPLNRNDISFGPGHEFPFSELKNPVLEWIFKDLGVQQMRVQHQNGWDHVTLKLSKAVNYDLNSKIDDILKIAETMGILNERDKKEFLSGMGRQIVNLVSYVQLDNEISYTGKMDHTGSVEAKDLKGVKVKAGFVKVTPTGGVIHSDSTATVKGKIGFMPIPGGSHPVPEAFAQAVAGSIKQIDEVRNRA